MHDIDRTGREVLLPGLFGQVGGFLAFQPPCVKRLK
jgi:hypothetical protein